VSNWARYLAGVGGFGFGLVWMTAGRGRAIVSVLLGALAYGSVVVAERARAGATTRRPLTFERPRDYEVPAEDAPLVGEVEYGWPSATAG
jgi:hypothetical protein